MISICSCVQLASHAQQQITRKIPFFRSMPCIESLCPPRSLPSPENSFIVSFPSARTGVPSTSWQRSQATSGSGISFFLQTTWNSLLKATSSRSATPQSGLQVVVLSLPQCCIISAVHFPFFTVGAREWCRQGGVVNGVFINLIVYYSIELRIRTWNVGL